MSRLTKEEIIALGLEGMHQGETEVIQIEIKDPYPPTRYSGVIEPKTGHTMFFRHAGTEPWTPVSTMHIENGDLLRVSVRDKIIYIEADADGARQGAA